MPNKTITFGADLLPNSESGEYNLGSQQQYWTIFGNLSGGADSVKYALNAANTKAYLMGINTAPNATATAYTTKGDTGVYLTGNTGQLSAIQYSLNINGTEKAYLCYNSSTESIDFIFN